MHEGTAMNFNNIAAIAVRARSYLALDNGKTTCTVTH